MRALLIFALALMPGYSAFAADAALPGTIGTKGYIWNKLTPERAEALRKTADAERGKEAFRGCRGCHKQDAFGRVDGIYPRLTGQYASVIVKQLTDIRAGLRYNPKMEPFISPDAVSVDEIADIALYLSTLTTIKENGKGPGDQVRVGEALYTQKGCVKCHGGRGEGNGEKLYPALAAQHYSYLLREMEFIKTMARGNSHPDMVAALRDISTAEMEALADYLARLPDRRLGK
ncbi:MAG: c-type cytochrome [Sideroxyarcus sp.]